MNKSLRTATFTVWAIVSAFGLYACMYAFRKPFTVSSFSGYTYWGIDLKILLVVAQAVGYTISKFVGISFIPSTSRQKRAFTIVALVLFAEFSLYLFSIVPPPWNILCLFLNGLPLGMIWGLVFSYLEGRRYSDLLGAGLCASFIVSSGFVKSFGQIMLDKFHLNAFNMPYITGLIFLLPIFIFIWMLHRLPPPDQEEENTRGSRVPMTGKEKITALKQIMFGLIPLTLLYVILTMFREVRDNFASDIWNTINPDRSAMIFTYTEIPVGLIVIFFVGLTFFIKKEKTAFIIQLLYVLLGTLLIGTCTTLFYFKLISPISWMVLNGIGMYIGYVPFNSVLFDRLIGALHIRANASLYIYFADSIAYLSSIFILLMKNFAGKGISWYKYFFYLNYIVSILGIIMGVVSLIYFIKKFNTSKQYAVIK